MRQTVVDFLSVPKDLRQEYWQDTVQKNRLSLFIICIMIVGMELFNMARVLFMSSAKLGTLNNRIYFGLYCSLFLVGLLFLIFFRPMRKLPVRAQWGLQCGVLIFTFLWHAGINAYDLLRDPNNGTSIVTTAILDLLWLSGIRISNQLGTLHGVLAGEQIIQIDPFHRKAILF